MLDEAYYRERIIQGCILLAIFIIFGVIANGLHVPLATVVVGVFFGAVVSTIADLTMNYRRIRKAERADSIGFMDGIDFQHHLGHDSKGTRVFPTAVTLRREAKCIETGGCGVVKVQVRFIEWVEKQDLKWEHTNHTDSV